MREDIKVYNEANGWAVWSRGLGGRTRQEAMKTLDVVAAEGSFIGIELAQDGGFVARLVLGDLTLQEEQSWCARVRRRLELPAGRLVLSGGFDPRGGDPEGDEFCHIRNVPPGSYRADIYTCSGLPGAEGGSRTELGFIVQLRPLAEAPPLGTPSPVRGGLVRGS